MECSNGRCSTTPKYLAMEDNYTDKGQFEWSFEYAFCLRHLITEYRIFKLRPASYGFARSRYLASTYYAIFRLDTVRRIA